MSPYLRKRPLTAGRTVLEIDVIGIDRITPAGGGTASLVVPTANELERLASLAIASAGIEDGHVAIEFVDADRIQALNRDHRNLDEPTDVLSFAIDGDGAVAGPRELGDIVICPEHTEDLREAVIHGALHLTGMDHETDDGEMLALQAELLRWAR